MNLWTLGSGKKSFGSIWVGYQSLDQHIELWCDYGKSKVKSCNPENTKIKPLFVFLLRCPKLPRTSWVIASSTPAATLCWWGFPPQRTRSKTRSLASSYSYSLSSSYLSLNSAHPQSMGISVQHFFYLESTVLSRKSVPHSVRIKTKGGNVWTPSVM